MEPTVGTVELAYEERGLGQPIVFVPGLTFNRATWRPIVERLAPQFRCVSIDLPGQGESAGPGRPMQEVADALHRSLMSLGVEPPVLVGHSLGAAIASMYASKYPATGVVNVDAPPLVEPMAAAIRALFPALERDFDRAFEPFRRSMGVEALPEPMRSFVTANRTVDRDVVLGYWRELVEQPAADYQRSIDAGVSTSAPYLMVTGHALSAATRAHFDRLLPHAQIEQWPGLGHMVHLAAPDKFAELVASFARTGAQVAWR